MRARTEPKLVGHHYTDPWYWYWYWYYFPYWYWYYFPCWYRYYLPYLFSVLSTILAGVLTLITIFLRRIGILTSACQYGECELWMWSSMSWMWGLWDHLENYFDIQEKYWEIFRCENCDIIWRNVLIFRSRAPEFQSASSV